MNEKNITVTNIERVFYVSNKFPPGNIVRYSDGVPQNVHQLVFRVKGGVLTDFDGVLLRNTKDTVEYLPKGWGKRYVVETLETGECIDISFDSDCPLFNVPVCIESKELRVLFSQIYKIWLKKSENYYYEAMSVLYKIFAVLKASSDENQKRNPYYKRIMPAVEYLNENYCTADIDFTYVAGLCDMSYSYFRRIFGRCMGISPAKYIIQKRIEHAKELLISGHYNVSGVAEATGFKDVYYFSAVFKKLTGNPPSAIKKTFG